LVSSYGRGDVQLTETNLKIWRENCIWQSGAADESKANIQNRKTIFGLK